jgi:hypothetical protein
MLRGANNLPVREERLRRREGRSAGLGGDAAQQRRLATYGLSPRGGGPRTIEVFNEVKLVEILRRTPDSSAGDATAPHAPSAQQPVSPRVKFSVKHGSGAQTAREHTATGPAEEPPMSKKEWRRQMLQEKHNRNMDRTRRQVARSLEAAGHRRELRFQRNLKELRDNEPFV